MSGIETSPVADVMADLEAVCESVATGTPADVEVIHRVRQRAEEVRTELRANGPVDVAVELLRESRDDNE